MAGLSCAARPQWLSMLLWRPSAETCCWRLADGATRRVLHVQSISAWAPSCIGPYSQAVAWLPLGLALFAGQIGLDPATMQLLPRRDQAARSLASCRAVATAMRCNLQAGLLGCTVYAAGCGGDVQAGQARDEVRERGADAGSSSAARPVLEQAAELLCDMLALQGGTDQQHDAMEERRESCAHDGDPGCGEEDLDVYLRMPAMPARHWAPLLTFVAVPGLPRGAAVEVQPLACTADGLGAGLRPGWADDLRNVTRQFPVGVAASVSSSAGCDVLSSALVSAGRVCLLQFSLPRAALEDQPAGLHAAAGAVLREASAAALAAAQLHVQHVLSIRAYYCDSLLSERQAGMALDAAFGAPEAALEDGRKRLWQPAHVMVPVIAVGGTPAVDAALHIVVMAINAPGED